MTRNEKISLLLAFNCFSERLPDRAIELIEKAVLGISALKYAESLYTEAIQKGQQKDYEVIYRACYWIDMCFLPTKISEC